MVSKLKLVFLTLIDLCLRGLTVSDYYPPFHFKNVIFRFLYIQILVLVFGFIGYQYNDYVSFLIIFFAYIFQAEVGIDMVAVEIDMEAAEVVMEAVVIDMEAEVAEEEVKWF